ncbi:response regulator [Hyphomicrobium sp.]|jgi:two-component system probable response regulator PhcQ|uniref:response regulator n=1 Tax=Hyphomicrobium sp. TaxID=82 RepID=UPI00356AB6BE
MASKTKTSNDKKSGTILFVDDEPLSLKYFQASVGKYAKVKTASSPDAAMEILESDGDEISVVVSDERMPRESGVSFLSDVRKSWPSTVRVLTSAYANIDNLQHAINDAAIYRFVPKPWNLDELCAAMQDALEVERSASALVEPALGPMAGGDAEDANLALLAILASGFDTPLKSLETEALQLAELGRQGTLEAPHPTTSYMASWSSRLRMSKMTASASQVQKDVEHCRSLANSIGKLARGLANPAGIPTSSMSDTLQEVIEQNRKGSFSGPVLDTSCDFLYQVPREIMKFVLASLLRGGARTRQSQASGAATIELFSGAAHNEVRISLGPDHPPACLDDNQSWRTIRSALWAFGGELLVSADENVGNSTLVLCLPQAK